MKYSWILAAAAIGCAITGTAHAGPIELFTDVGAQPGTPDTFTLRYIYGAGGLFRTTDGGANFGLICNSAIDPSIASDQYSVGEVFAVGANAMYIGTPQVLLRGDLTGCNWKPVPELMGKWVGALAVDPIDPTITYLATGNGSGMNGVWTNDGKSDAWTQLGTPSSLFYNTLQVVKNGSGRRFIVTGVDSSGTAPKYYTLVSDDQAKTWQQNELTPIDQFGTMDVNAEMRIVAVDPTNPSQIVAVIDRSDDRAENKTVDDIIYSSDLGKTWKLITHVTTASAVIFKPDGSLVFGDNDQDTPGLYVLSKLGAAPKQIAHDWKVGCLDWDATHSRMYACDDWRFGTADLTTGVFTPSLDLRTAKNFAQCPGEDMATVCKDQLLAGYCGIGHYPEAPLCSVYNSDRPWFDPTADYGAPNACGCAMPGGAGGSSAAGGMSGGSGMSGGATAIAGAGGTAGVSTPVGGSSATAGAAAAGTGGTAPAKKSGGCSVAEADGPGSSGGLAMLMASALFVVRRSRRRTSVRHRSTTEQEAGSAIG